MYAHCVDRHQALQAASPAITLDVLDLTAYARGQAPGSTSTSVSGEEPAALVSRSHAQPSADHTAARRPSRTAVTALYPGCSADALVVWMELTSGAQSVSTAQALPAPPTSGNDPTFIHEATTSAANLSLSQAPAEAPSPQPAAPESHDQQSDLQTAAGADSSNDNSSTVAHGQCPPQIYHSSSIGLGLYYLDSRLMPHTSGCVTPVELRTSHAPAAARLSFDVHVTSNLHKQTAEMQNTTGANHQRSRATAENTPGHLQLPQDRMCTEAHSNTVGGLLLGDESTAMQGRDDRMTTSSSCLIWSWSSHGTARHAWLPRWHFDMIGDNTRNAAYEAALR